MTISITAIGTANPPYHKTQSDVADFMIDLFKLDRVEARRLNMIYRATGIEKRHSVISDYGNPKEAFQFFKLDPITQKGSMPSTKTRMKIYQENALSLALLAIEDCLGINNSKHPKNDFNPHSITHVITVSCTGMYAPGLDIEIIHALQLSTNTERIAINFMGCYGVFNALKVANAICCANKTAKVLIVSVELCSLHIQEAGNLDNLVAGAIFSDGAAALLVETPYQNNSENQKKAKYLTLEHFYCDLIKKGNQDMTWAIADHGFDIILSSYVPLLIGEGIKEFVGKCLEKTSFDIKNIDYYAIHPGGIKILEECERSLELDPKQCHSSYQVLKNFGNMSSATIGFVLKDLWLNFQQQDHQKSIFSCAFGPGLTLESMLLKIHV